MTEKQQDQCQFYLERKKRLCRFRPRPGETYCPEHACVLGIQSERKRIPCPLNPKHNCYEDDLQNHLRKCPVAKKLEAMTNLPCYVKNINLGQVESADSKTFELRQQSVKELTNKKLGEIIERVHRLYKDFIEDIEALHLEHGSVKEHMGNTELSLANTFGEQVILKKELLQQASLVGQLDDLGFLSQNHCFVELGAGKGKLSHWIQIASRPCTGNSFILVDRGNARYKMDSYHKGEGGEGKFHRIKIDIKDLYLGKVPEMQGKSSVIVVGKHLCGGATDMGIRCAVDTLKFKPENIIDVQNDKSGSNVSSKPKSSNAAGTTPAAEGKLNLLPEDALKNESFLQSSDLDKRQNSSVSILKDDNISSVQADADHSVPVQVNSDDKKVSTLDQCPRRPSLNDDDADSPPAKILRKEEAHFQRLLPKGIMIALCCHHRCTWDTYVGKDFMEEINIGPEEFDILTRLSSWATCARVRVKNPNEVSALNFEHKTARARKAKGEQKDSNDDKQMEKTRKMADQEDHLVEDLIAASNLEEGESLRREDLTVSEREDIGRKCKRIIDKGRMQYLKSKGMNCFLREYVDERQTPENIVLIATHTVDKLQA